MKRNQRIAVATIVFTTGALLPYLVRLIRGERWLMQYIDVGAGALLLQAFNAIPLCGIFALTYIYRRVFPIIFPILPTFGFLAYGHYNLDLASDAQAGIALVFIPIYAVAFVAAGGVVGLLVDRLIPKAR